MNKFYNIGCVEFEENTLIHKIDNNNHKFDLEKYPSKILNASKIQRDNYEVSPSGYGIFWPMIDEDLSIDGLPGITLPFPSGKKAG